MRSGAAKSVVGMVLVAASLAACGGGGSSGNGVASKSANGILAAAESAAGSLSSIHVAGSITKGTTKVSLDLRIAAGKGATGTIAEGALKFNIIELGDAVYISGGPALWKHYGGAAAAALFKGKWLKTSTTNGFSSFDVSSPHAVIEQLLGSHGILIKGATTTVDGQPVVALKDKNKPGTLYVATTGKPYPVELAGSGSEQGRIVFDDFNAAVSVSAPANSIDLQQLQKLAG
jgi:hypothetical protein